MPWDLSALRLTPALRLSGFVVVCTTDAIRLCRGGAFEALAPRQAVSRLAVRKRDLSDLRSFLGQVRLVPLPLPTLNDGEALLLLRRAITAGVLTAIQVGGPAVGDTPNATAERRNLVRAIQAKTGGRLSLGGRAYRLVVDVDIGRLPDRDRYEVTRHDGAANVLRGISAQPGTGAELSRLLARAADQLAADWHPPYSPDGLVLLRRTIVPKATAAPTEAMTPSQMRKALTKTEWIEIQVTDDLGKPYRGPYEIELPDGTSTTGNFDQEGLWGDYDIVPGNCKLIKPDLRQATKPDVALTTDTIWVRLDIDPDQAARSKEMFELTGSAGYQQTKTVKDDLVRGDAYVDLEFTGVDPNQRFTLRVISDGSEPHEVFRDLEFGQSPAEPAPASDVEAGGADSDPSREEVASEE